MAPKLCSIESDDDMFAGQTLGKEVTRKVMVLGTRLMEVS
jgi:hypothetical protein